MGVCEKGVRCRGAEESQPSSCHQECEERESQERAGDHARVALITQEVCVSSVARMISPTYW